MESVKDSERNSSQPFIIEESGSELLDTNSNTNCYNEKMSIHIQPRNKNMIHIRKGIQKTIHIRLGNRIVIPIT